MRYSMDKRIESLVIECAKHGVPITDVRYNAELDTLEFQLEGFAKSGSALLTKDEEGNVILKTRYNEIDRVNSFDDIAVVALRWQQYAPGNYTLPEWFKA